jgi:peptidoglycan/xylan/chitin deacetylase (PgdA/CDA1 family)
MTKLIALLFVRLKKLAFANSLLNNFHLKDRQEPDIIVPYVARRKVRNVQILVYHRVNDEKDPFFPGTPVDVFAMQMSYLAANFTLCDLGEAVERIIGRDVPDNTVVITLDDGYRDNFVNAFPVLKKLSIPATIFLPTDAIDSDRALWHETVCSAFKQTSLPFLEVFTNRSKVYPLRKTEDKILSLLEVLNFLRSLGDDERSFFIEQLIKELDVEHKKKPAGLMLTWDQVKIMHQGGISFGAHTVTHPILSKAPYDKAKWEIWESKRIIEEKLGTRVTAFAYPSGRKEDFNEDIKNAIREAGYACALTTIFGTNGDGSDLFELRREHPWERHIPQFAMKLCWHKIRF